MGLANDAISLIKSLGVSEALVSYSAGADSTACMDLCARAGVQPVPYFWYMVPGLEMLEPWFSAAEKRWGRKVLQFPGPSFARDMAYGRFRPNLPKKYLAKMPDAVSVSSILEAARKRSGCEWVLLGHRMNDSFVRRGMLKPIKGVDTKHHKAYPVWNWKREHVFAYLRERRLPIHPMSQARNKWGFNSINSDNVAWIKEHYPRDYERILKFFPYVSVLLAHDDKFGNGWSVTTPPEWRKKKADEIADPQDEELKKESV